DPLDLREIVGLALRAFEPLESGIETPCTGIRSLDNAGCLTATAAQVIELRPAHFSAADHLDVGNVGRVKREYALHALAVRDLPDGEVLVEARAGARDHHALISLGAHGVAFDHLDHHPDRIARTELGDHAFRRDRAHLLGLEHLDDVHDGTSTG